ncbi:MAG: hypothetical protein VKJ24_07860 [Synechococcales bacterium]|nr:hypothetical protein [Synechococcales bacterium]
MTQLKRDRSYKRRSGHSAARKIETGGSDRDPIQVWLIGKPKDVQATINIYTFVDFPKPMNGVVPVLGTKPKPKC